ncbi:hypothetical protein OKA04_10310 [Luteolibacter flavescens]|uniref:Uncharacterized protein n=1 Tax=Luteolibacter flavescens TaxID=1859460 RepID=A0ABT3FNH6_9BACT|nr:hypothetical protein [Luteolibacter flavescens]MCW1885121.1 hypothetical protein [Luteolibacter flavescens]
MRILAFICCLLPLSLSAQEKKGERTCRVLFLGAAASDPETLFLHDGTAATEVELPRMNLSKVYEVPSGAITLRMLTAAPAKDQPVPAGAPSATVAETVGDFYLVLSPDPTNKTVPVRMQIIDATAERFKAGQMQWFNLTPNDVAGTVGKQKLVLKARSKVITDAPASAVEPYHVSLNFRIPGKEANYPLCETQWNHDPAARTLLFVINEGGSRTPRVLGFPDHRTTSGKNP